MLGYLWSILFRPSRLRSHSLGRSWRLYRRRRQWPPRSIDSMHSFGWWHLFGSGCWGTNRWRPQWCSPNWRWKDHKFTWYCTGHYHYRIVPSWRGLDTANCWFQHHWFLVFCVRSGSCTKNLRIPWKARNRGYWVFHWGTADRRWPCMFPNYWWWGCIGTYCVGRKKLHRWWRRGSWSSLPLGLCYSVGPLCSRPRRTALLAWRGRSGRWWNALEIWNTGRCLIRIWEIRCLSLRRCSSRSNLAIRSRPSNSSIS